MEERKEEKGTIEMIGWEDLKKCERNPSQELLLQSIGKLEPEYWSGVKLVEDYLYGAFRFHEERKRESQILTGAFLLNEQKFVLAVLKGESEIRKQMEESLQKEDLQKNGEEPKMEEGLEALFEGILKQGQQKVEQMEKYLMDVEQEIVKGKINRNRNQTIFECKRSLAVWKNDYAQFLNLVESINGLEQKKKEDQGQILSEESACYFRVYENKLRRLTEETQFLYEELVHIREALDAALSYEQNRIMKVFTTVTTVFMPLSLIAGWYGMNFVFMPELQWKYGYVFVGILSALVVLVCIWFFKRKKLF
ncbi:MAG: hypothetical protein HFH41_07975 [Lachnospiraceae bacterium]|nr:hypothetical protein [Lachnospiraceae bacterium]